MAIEDKDRLTSIIEGRLPINKTKFDSCWDILNSSANGRGSQRHLLGYLFDLEGSGSPGFALECTS